MSVKDGSHGSEMKYSRMRLLSLSAIGVNSSQVWPWSAGKTRGGLLVGSKLVQRSGAVAGLFIGRQVDMHDA